MKLANIFQNKQKKERQEATARAFEANKLDYFLDHTSPGNSPLWEAAGVVVRTKYEDVAKRGLKGICARDPSFDTSKDVPDLLKYILTNAQVESVKFDVVDDICGRGRIDWVRQMFTGDAGGKFGGQLREYVFQKIVFSGKKDELAELCVMDCQSDTNRWRTKYALRAFEALQKDGVPSDADATRRYAKIGSEASVKEIVRLSLAHLIGADYRALRATCAKTEFRDLGEWALGEQDKRINKLIGDMSHRAWERDPSHNMNLTKEEWDDIRRRRNAQHGGDYESAGCHRGDLGD